MHDGDRRRRQRRVRVEVLDRAVVPVLDLAEVDVGDRLAVELEALVDARQVVGHGDRPEDGRDLDRRALLEPGLVVGRQRRVAGREADRPGLQRRDARTGAGRVVVQGHALALEVAAPLHVDGGRERGARPADRRWGHRRRGRRVGCGWRTGRRGARSCHHCSTTSAARSQPQCQRTGDGGADEVSRPHVSQPRSESSQGVDVYRESRAVL